MATSHKMPEDAPLFPLCLSPIRAAMVRTRASTSREAVRDAAGEAFTVPHWPGLRGPLASSFLRAIHPVASSAEARRYLHATAGPDHGRYAGVTHIR